MSKLVQRGSNAGVGSTLEAYRSGCNNGCEVKDVLCICFGKQPTAGTTTTVAAQTSSGSC